MAYALSNFLFFFLLRDSCLTCGHLAFCFYLDDAMQAEQKPKPEHLKTQQPIDSRTEL